MWNEHDFDTFTYDTTPVRKSRLRTREGQGCGENPRTMHHTYHNLS